MKAPLLLCVPLLLVLGTAPSDAQGTTRARVALLDAAAAAGRSPGGIELLALKRIFSTIGVPADVVRSVDRLSDYRAVFAAGALVNTAVTPGLSNGLFDYVESGGTLVAAGEAGNSLYPLFGLTLQSPSRRRYRLSFVARDPATAFIDDPRERTISLGNGERHFFDDVVWSHGASLSAEATALARFDDGSAGFSVHPYGRGKAYLLGVSYADSVLLPQVGGSYNAERQYANGFEPSADVIMLILKAICSSSYSPFVSLATIPYARPEALVLTHDVDAQSSFVDSLKFADLEAKYGARSTFFVTTKYFIDASDIDYFNVPGNIEALRQLARRGWDIGSHTVSHSAKLAEAPEGDPKVTRATYDPRMHLTVWGEARVSKELLDQGFPGRTTVAYRSGDLAFPRSLIRVLEGCGYRYDSTYSANAVLTSFPYFALEDQVLGSAESSVVEVPVTFDDSQGYLRPDNVSSVVRGWREVVRADGRLGGLSVLLMHPSDTRTRTYKLEAQEKLMQAVSSEGGWMGDLSSVGRFWRARANLSFSALPGRDGNLVIRVDLPGRDLDPAIGFEIQGWTGKVRMVDGNGDSIDCDVVLRGGKMYAVPGK